MSKRTINDYVQVTRQQNIDELMLLAEKLQGLKVKMVNSTAVGGGVAEMLHRIIPLYNQLGLDVTWDVIKGGGDFFNVTKAFHNALHGSRVEITQEMFNVYRETNEHNSRQMAFDSDVVIVHDPQPLLLVSKRNSSRAKWVWRCHIDTAKPNPAVWEYLQFFVRQYDASIFSSPSFAKELPNPQYLIYPAIDPFADKNRELSQSEIEAVLNKFHIPNDKPIIVQISRFDYLKDPLGVFETFRLIKKSHDCRFVYAGGTANDDPEGAKVLAELQEKAAQEKDFHILLLPDFADIEVNALQRAATIVMQKSLREGFGLTVTEALWKGKPVVASAVGGIPLQVIHNFTGLLAYSIEGAAYQIRYLLNNPQAANRLGVYGREHVREKFLITRKIRSYLLLFIALAHKGESIIQL
ncbi:glycosyl transferase family 1 [candidate division WOR-1 bacterium RIFOXYB2_FULL_48_7]|uniref:Glycosyl transferase family 1 n=1 Tax=candidate division WOR-1 bacterium RIFOXYB2_FULL_48_7 TaxID=1802583 RepID=A0A1F4TRU9_UNCSA|nr:MAG: glycosyl transferase family 1 [candidate division WOR-1 bacterium RIFOXYB2_FULL_48_7]